MERVRQMGGVHNRKKREDRQDLKNSLTMEKYLKNSSSLTGRKNRSKKRGQRDVLSPPLSRHKVLTE